MAEHAPEGLKYFAREMVKLGGVLSGIVGDSAHTWGYHRGRNYVSSGDYSVQLPEDRLGNGEAASAVDWSLSTSLMKTMSTRLAQACDRGDPRVKCLREWYGTTNGTSVTGRTHSGSSDTSWSFASSDSSHLWHIHFSFLRQHNNTISVMNDILSVLRGGPAGTTTESFLESGKPETWWLAKQLNLLSKKSIVDIARSL